MRRLSATNPRNESQIDVVADEQRKHSSAEAFYAAATRWLSVTLDSDDEVERRIAAAGKRPCAVEELQRVVAECLESTPVEQFVADFGDVEVAFSFREDWNDRELVWRSAGNYWLVSWGTSA